MPEKVFFGLKSSMWGIVIAWNQIILCVLKLLHTIYHTAFMLYYHVEHSYTGDENLVATVSNITYEDSDTPFEFEESFHYGYLLILIEVLLFICGFVFALVMGVVLLKGCQQRHVPYLKAWLIFAIISIFWNILYFGLITLAFGLIAELIIEYLEVCLFLTLYMFGIWIIYNLMITILTEQNPGGEILPKYDSLVEEPL